MLRSEPYGNKPLILRAINVIRSLVARRQGWRLVGMSNGFYKELGRQGLLR